MKTFANHTGFRGGISRRDFMAWLGVGFATGAGAIACESTERRSAKEPTGAPGSPVHLQRHAWSEPVFGTEAKFIVLNEDPAIGARAKAWVSSELQQVEKVLSLCRADSELCRLNREGKLARPHPFMVHVLLKAQQLSELTNGAFDVTVQPLWELYAAAKAAGRTPEPGEIERARQKVDWRKLTVCRDEIQLSGPGMAVTLNALAQGFAADRVLAVLRERSIQHALVNPGEIGAMGRKEGGESWTVGIQHPRMPEAYAGLARLDDCCMATSGDYATRFTDDYRKHHIFDPATGQSPRELASATVVARSGLEADGLATAILVLGREKGLKLLTSFPGAEAFLVLKEGQTTHTAGFPLA